MLDASAKLERNALAGVLAHPALRPLLAELTPEHFYDPLHRALRAHIVDGAPLDETASGCSPSSTRDAEAEGIGEATGDGAAAPAARARAAARAALRRRSNGAASSPRRSPRCASGRSISA